MRNFVHKKCGKKIYKTKTILTLELAARFLFCTFALAVRVRDNLVVKVESCCKFAVISIGRPYAFFGSVFVLRLQGNFVVMMRFSLLVLLSLFALASCQLDEWWKETIVYQIYPRSFQVCFKHAVSHNFADILETQF